MSNQNFELFPICLCLFDGEGGGPAGGGDGGAAPGESQAGPASTQQADPSGADPSPDAGEHTPTPDELQNEFDALTKGKYKEQYGKNVQAIIDRRVKSFRTAEKAMQDQAAARQPIMDMLAQQYGITDGDPAKIQQALENDTAFWELRAEQAGMDPEAYRQQQRFQLQQQNFYRQQQAFQRYQAAQADAQRWSQEAQAVKEQYPDFDLSADMQDSQFRTICQSFGVKAAYEFCHRQEIMDRAVTAARTSAEKNVTDSIRAQGKRPREAGGSASGAVKMTKDYSKMSSADFLAKEWRKH